MTEADDFVVAFELGTEAAGVRLEMGRPTVNLPGTGTFVPFRLSVREGDEIKSAVDVDRLLSIHSLLSLFDWAERHRRGRRAATVDDDLARVSLIAQVDGWRVCCRPLRNMHGSWFHKVEFIVPREAITKVLAQLRLACRALPDAYTDKANLRLEPSSPRPWPWSLFG